MTEHKHLSPVEFDAFMRKRISKELEKQPKDKKGFICGNYFDVYFTDNKLVECAKCGVPLYVRPYIYDIAKERNLTVLCMFCVPSDVFKGRVVQDMAAVLQYTGEK